MMEFVLFGVEFNCDWYPSVEWQQKDSESPSTGKAQALSLILALSS